MRGSSLNTIIVAVTPETLDGAGRALVWLGLGVAFAAALRHWRRAGADPLRNAKTRGNRVAPTLVLVPALGYLLAEMTLVPVRERLEASAAPQAAMQGLSSLAQIIGGALCLWVGATCFRGGARGFLLGRSGVARPVVTALVYLLAAGALCEVTAQATKWVFVLFDPAYTFKEHPVIDALHDPSEPGWAPVVLWLSALVVAPLAEECFFRGMLQTMLLRALRRRWIAVLVPALLFGLAHANQPHVVPALTLFGIILGIQYERSGALIGPIALHAMFNLKTLLWQWLVTMPGGP